jgi:hypothetical protein
MVDVSLIILGVIFLVVVVLLLKFVKKVLHALVGIFIAFVLVLAGVGGLLYYDYAWVANQEDFDVHVLVDSSERDYGISFPFVDKEPIFSEVRSMSEEEIEELDADSLEKGDGKFALVIDESVISALLAREDDEYTYEGKSGSEKKYTKSQVQNLLSSEELSLLDDLVAEEEIGALGPQEFALLLILENAMSDKEGLIILAKGFKDENLLVYPERWSFKLFRAILPAETMANLLLDEEE